MMGTKNPDAVSFIVPPPFEQDSRLDTKIKVKLLEHLHDDIKIGYHNPDQRETIAESIIMTFNTLYVAEKHRNEFSSREFPCAPEKD